MIFKETVLKYLQTFYKLVNPAIYSRPYVDDLYSELLGLEVNYYFKEAQNWDQQIKVLNEKV